MWNKHDWKKRDTQQQPQYQQNPQIVSSILETLERFPPLVFPGEVTDLKTQIAKAGRGECFILQGGDCAERFIDCDAQLIMNKLKILLQMSIVLTHAMRKPIIRLGRIAGQYAKPRSSPTETVNGVVMPSYRGDIINDFSPVATTREPDPQRLLQAFHNSAITLNYIRAMIDGGFADLHNPFTWNLHSIENSSRWPKYKEVVERILDSINFMEAFGGVNQGSLGRIQFFTSHEGLLLNYETALTRTIADKPFNLGAHFLWIGERTRQLDGGHVEYFRGIDNPIGVKIGPSCSPEELDQLIRILNPDNEPGKLTLITRFGKDKIAKCLPPLIKHIQKHRHIVTWSCDPMHGNTVNSNGNIKTRAFDAILDELSQCFDIHRSLDSILAGVHFELTGEDVTECTGGAQALQDLDLTQNYQSYCDPRLNYTQSIEMAFLIAKLRKTY